METMSTAAKNYSTLIAKTQPKVIHSEEQNEQFIALLEDLDERWDSLTPAERELHELVALLIEDFESRHYKLRSSSPIKIIEELMAANGLKQKDLVGIFETPSVVSEVLNRKRDLTKDHIRRLSGRFNVSPELFF
jgi:HTH-type transcriptional regulator/antitoxin HigA